MIKRDWRFEALARRMREWYKKWENHTPGWQVHMYGPTTRIAMGRRLHALYMGRAG